VEAGAVSISSGGSAGDEARPFAINPKSERVSSSFVTARNCAGKVKKG
jgi:hypothetical protein